MTPVRTLLLRLERFAGVDSDWDCPVQPVTRGDIGWCLSIGLVCLAAVVVSQPLGVFGENPSPLWRLGLAVMSGWVLLIWRRRFPLAVVTLASVHMFVTGVAEPYAMAHATLQLAYFIAFYSAAAWARDRRMLLVTTGSCFLILMAWLAWQYAYGSAVAQLHEELSGKSYGGLMPPIVASILLTAMVNLAFFGGANALGQFAWNNRRDQAVLAAQAKTISSQSETLRRAAVIAERMRIARELHDVVAHHVAVIGIQAAAARRVLTRDPDAAVGALGEIEHSSREAVTSMRDLLGTLRAEGREPGNHVVDRTPKPGAAAIADLVQSHHRAGVRTAYTVIAETDGAVDALPASVGLTLYRITQEALANVARHSTATQVSAVLRVRSGPAGFAEIEIVDNGRPRRGTSGSGLGQLGIRERVSSHTGELDLGPRVGGGYRVRARLPVLS